MILHGILNAVGETDLVKAQDKIMAEVQQVSGDMTQFIMAMTAAVWQEHFGPEIHEEARTTIADAPDVLDVWMPFFVEISPEDTSGEDRAGGSTKAMDEKLSISRIALARSRARISR